MKARHLSILGAASIAAVACAPAGDDSFRGYVEGEYVYVAAPFSGFLEQLAVRRGQRVAAGQRLFAIAADPERHQLAEAEAKTDAAAARAENLRNTRREPEIRALEADLMAARAALALAESRLQQETALASRQFVADARVDDAVAQRDQARARVRATDAQLALARRPFGRTGEARAASDDERAAAALAAQRRWLFERREGSAPTAGDLADTYYRPGEWVPAGSAIVSLLPDDGRRLRFFVPETRLADIRLGMRIEALCDSCPSAIPALVDFIAPQAEFTPPVIYSRGSREKLVFRVEAKPDASATGLPPGLPIDVHLVQ